MFASWVVSGGRADIGVAFTDRDDDFAALRTTLGVSELVGVNQVHGGDVALVQKNDSGALIKSRPDADALITTLTGIGLRIQVADCVPVLLADQQSGIIGAAHAGRRGLLAGVLTNIVHELRELGAHTIDAWVGPHICSECYEVPLEMAEAAWAQIPATRAMTRVGTPSIDLGNGVITELENLGCRVEMRAQCTAETPSLFSYRRDKQSRGRQTGIIWLV